MLQFADHNLMTVIQYFLQLNSSWSLITTWVGENMEKEGWVKKKLPITGLLCPPPVVNANDALNFEAFRIKSELWKDGHKIEKF